MHDTTKRSTFRTTLAVELARAGRTQTELAVLLGVPPTTLSTWLTGAHPAPVNLASRIECTLGLRRGLLTSTQR
jgi:DNA-binding transcriptional regulator YdaS (Cro superfamily)